MIVRTGSYLLPCRLSYTLLDRSLVHSVNQHHAGAAQPGIKILLTPLACMYSNCMRPQNHV